MATKDRRCRTRFVSWCRAGVFHGLIACALLTGGFGCRSKVDALPEDVRPSSGHRVAAKGHAPVVGERAQVLGVYDGDTIRVDLEGVEEKVRVIGVDTPERPGRDHDGQEGYREATAFTKSFCAKGRTVLLQRDSFNKNRDKYERLLRHVRLLDGRDLARELIREGLGFAFVRFPFEGSAEHLALEAVARQAGRGVWAPQRIHEASWRDPMPHLWEVVRVRGRIVGTHQGQKLSFLNFAEHYKDRLSLVVYAAANDQFPSEVCKLYEGRRVEVVGRMSVFRGQAQIAIGNPDQIQLLD